MSHARSTFIGVAAVALLVCGCAAPAWFADGDFPRIGKHRAMATRNETTAAASGESVRATGPASTSLGGEPSLSQVLDDLERIKYRSPSDFAVIQSALENTSNLFPTPYQQLYKDQMLGMALKQQEQPTRPLAEPTVVPQPYQVPAADVPLAQSPVSQVTPHVSTPVVVAPASHAVDATAVPLTANVSAPPNAVVTTRVSDLQPVQPTFARQPAAATAGPSASAAATEVTKEFEIEPGQWNREIEEVLASLSAELARPNLDRDEKARLEITRRLLYVVTNQRDAAAAPIEQLDEDERECWKHQIHGLLVLIDADGKHPTTRRAALALRHFRTGADHLANVSTLDVSNLTFCKEVLSYGEYQVFDSYSFRAKDEVVLYVEIDNFAAHPRGDSFETELHSSYEIVDDAGRRVANVVLPVDKQVSNNRRRDYFIAYLITMPSQIAPGSYRLQLTVEDVIGKKSNHATIDFRIQ